MNENFDDLDRALFALPLETPPPGLRQTILRATIHATPSAAAIPFNAYEIGGIGVAIAVAVWLLIASIANPAIAVLITDDSLALVRGLSEPLTLAWLATGGSIAILLTLTSFTPLKRGARNGRS